MKRTVRLSESRLNRLINETVKQCLTELDWRTYASAAKKAEEWRKENPNHRANQWNRVMDFDRAAMNAFNDQHGYEPYDEEQYGGEVGRINPHFYNGEASISASRDHNFGDENTGSLPHTVYHMSKQYGKDGGYGRTRMWDYAHETTPEEFFDNDELANKYREMERDIEDYQNDNFEYTPKQGWHRIP